MQAHGEADTDTDEPVGESLEALAEITGSLADVVYALRLRPTLSFEYVSPSIEQLTGFGPDAFYLDPTLATGRLPADQAAQLRAAFEQSRDIATEVTVSWQRADGAVIWTQHRCRTHDRADGTTVVFVAVRDVTAQVVAEQALAESRASYQLIAENASDIVWRTTSAGVLTWVSPSVTAVLGWSPAEVLGRAVLDLVHPDDLPATADVIARVAAGERVTYEARIRRADGGYRWLEVTKAPLVLPDGADGGRVGSCRDIEGARAARAALALSESRVRLAMAFAPTGMAVVDAGGELLEVNPALAALLGRDEAWLRSHRLTDLAEPGDQTTRSVLRSALERGDAANRTDEVRLVRADGSAVWVQLSLGAVRADDQPASFVAQFTDVTESRAARETLRRHASRDPLTGLLNRRELLARLDLMLAHPRRRGTQLAVLYADLDGLKEANDRYGHAVGDVMLVEAGHRIRAQLREEDPAARIGGDEFVIVLPDVPRPEDAVAVARKVLAALSSPIVTESGSVPMGASLGLALARPNDDAAALLRRADSALYRAKALGGRAICDYDDR